MQVDVDTDKTPIVIYTDYDACYQVTIVASNGVLVYKGKIWSDNGRISIKGLEKDDYNISVSLLTKK